ncbi:TetR/AcrR family transcriptional regulator [Rossellomorea aquimaris]|uniref:TetR/AcrR family transcriptional regulator n=1 Tax=Rossellomorea aquimaris TaxID=189382 RepID=UPI0007D0995A|nr:TetR/AcrR family transcriptional regulator [Rossellomorea aquimaris]
MNGFEKRKQLKMKQIEDAAFFLFTKYGAQKVNIQDIAKKANVSQVTIYNYFGSKDDLLYTVFKNFMDRKMDQFIQLKNSSLDFKAKIETLIQSKLEDTETFCPEFIQEVLTQKGPIAELFQTYTERSVPLIHELLEEGKEKGYVSTELSLETLMFFLNSILSNFRMNKGMFSNEETKRQFIKETHHFIFYGLVGKQ